jgi:phosphoribosylformylglycinamidine cyclo-ligase
VANTNQGPGDGAYAKAGVNIDAGAEAVRLMKEVVRSTWDAGVLGQYGAFAGLYDPARGGRDGEILAVTIDSVGTKVHVAVMCGRFETVGMDIVNHCTDDLLVQRARPLLFADYYACSSLNPETVAEAVRGMSVACRVVGCNLVAGETAEMPGVYAEHEIDIVGCMIGTAKQADLDAAPAVAPGDVLIGIGSSGLHTNGYSLARQLLFEKAGMDVDTHVPELGRDVGEELLEVHREYLSMLGPFLSDPRIHGLAHITGGGFFDNVTRILPEGCRARIEKGSWEPLPIFQLLQSLGDLTDHEAYRVFNMGIGMVLAIEAAAVEEFLLALSRNGDLAVVIGEVAAGDRAVVLF